MSTSPKGAATESANGGARRRGRGWIVVAAGIVVVGLAMSLVGALLWRASERRSQRQTFESTSANVTATLGTLLRRDTDFVATLRGVLTMHPELSPTSYSTWYGTLQGSNRQPGGVGSAVVSRVPASELSSFERRRDADPVFRALIGRWLQKIPRGSASTYCVLAAGGRLIPFNNFIGPLVQQNWCTPKSTLGASQTPVLGSATDTGQFLAMPVDISSLHTMILEAAFYRLGAPLRTIAERRRAVTGWILTSFDISAVVRAAIGQNGGLRVTLYHNNPGQPQTFIASAGSASDRGTLTRTTSVPMYGMWTISVKGAPPGAAVSPTEQGVIVFTCGATLTILLLLLVLVLARSRDKALELVAEKTGQLRHQALHDSLTGLPNRVLALDRAEVILARARRLQSPAAALYFDIDGFKQVNDTFGHAVGDKLLQLVADRLRSVVRDTDTAARLSGDEFVVLLDPSRVASSPHPVAERLLEVMREPYDLNGTVGRQLALTASIGIAQGIDDTAERLLANADVALYVAKTSGKDRHVMFESGMLAAAHDRLTLEMDLAGALEGEQLFLLYQPTVALDSERVTGVEALLRWRHPTRGVIAPDIFIPLAEASGLIVPIGRWVLEHACAQAVTWREQGHDIRMSVNVSGRQLERDDDLVGHVRAALERSGLPAASLTLEITETILAHDAVVTAERLLKLKRLGVRIAIDDFGTGYSSLAYLREFPVDALKIDRSFIRTVSGSAQSAALIRTLVRLGKTLQLATLAEGIENQAQLRILRRHHCDEGQGFLFAKPLTPEQLEDYLAAPGHEAVAASG